MIIISHLTFAYDKAAPVFADFSAVFPDRGITLLLGSSGSGKTTLLHLLCGLLKPQGGHLQCPKKPAMMFQEDRLLPWLTVLENVTAVCGNEETARHRLELVKLEPSLHSRKPEKLSGGQCRRVALARVLSYSGDALLLDEPFTGLDEPLARDMMALLAKQAETIPVIISTHRPELAPENINIINLK